RGIEVGHIFYFGTKYSEPMRARVQTADGTEVPMEMGSYGVGVSRLLGALIEAHHDEQGPVWPVSVAPFHVGLINLKAGNEATDRVCEALQATLEKAGIDVLYDDTSDRAGEKFARMDLVGVPHQVVVGPRGLEQGELEWKVRVKGEKTSLQLDSAADALTRAVEEELAKLSA
ncbi:MAG: His/Gly/Thr/Pro-type tRNA ligase C-terminal domain-containing protein, partial [Pseudomonadota bacterium]